MLEALSPGLGWRVFSRYPEQFGSPEALECWRLLAAFLFTSGFPAEQVSRCWCRCWCLALLRCCPLLPPLLLLQQTCTPVRHRVHLPPA